MKDAVSWDVAPYSFRTNRRFGGSHDLNLQDRRICERVTEVSKYFHAHAGSLLADSSTLKMEAIRSSETSVHSVYFPVTGRGGSHIF
jgi:hypothetical protein